MDQDTIAIFLDIAAAFDTICPGLIKRKLLEHGGDPLMVYMMNKLQKVVTKLETWGQTAGLKFNSSKTEVVIFTKKRLRPEQMPPKLKVSGQQVEFSTTAKYLGVTLDHNLT